MKKSTKTTLTYRLLFIIAAMAAAVSFPVFSQDLPKQGSSQENQKETILAEFHKILSYDKEYRVTCQMATFSPNQKPVIRKYTLFNKNEKSLLIYTYPERDSGKKILLIKDQLWQYFPKIQKTIVINASMNLNGSLNLSDIVSSTLFQFYNLSGYEYNEQTKNHILTFLAVSKNSPYGKVRYFYQDGKIHYFEAYARSGILLKKIVFAKYELNDENQEIPVQLKIINALQENDYSLIQMSEIKNIKIPDYYFNPSAMEKVNE